MILRVSTFVLAGALTLAACDRPSPRLLRRAAVPVPAAVAVAAPASFPAAREVTGPIRWDAARGAFVADGKVLRAEKLWTFDGTSDGFVAAGGEAVPADRAGLAVRESGDALSLRTPRGLNVDGHTRSLFLVRLTRVKAARPWDGTVYYSTKAHGETQAFFAKPAYGADPAVNETQVLVYDMRQLRAGGEDWKTSIIDQVRVDLDAAPGGAFVVHQVAIAQSPEAALAEAQPKPPPRQPTLTLPDRPAAAAVATAKAP